ncbi:mitochondrial carrier domain-containing protein [Xylariaceae sp. FL0804]|nr:mitochondrial carrier domain-containing protein [Xylariaceae sp. FL0804]
MSSSVSSPLSNPSKLLPALHHALSGSVGTLIATCALYPLSLVVTRLQVQRQLRREGKLAPPDGASPEEGDKQQQQQQPTAYAGVVDAFARIWNAPDGGGPSAFYTGLAQDAAKSVLDSFLFFLFYEWFRALRLSRRQGRRSRRRGLGALEELAVGMAAGACSRAFTTPIASVVTRMQTASLVGGDDDEKNNNRNKRSGGGGGGVRAIARGIWAERGLAGFWSGYSATLLLTLNPGVTFLLQETLRRAVLANNDNDGGGGGGGDDDAYENPSARMTFLLAATSKAAASVVTYPFQIAKTRLQAGVPIEADADGDGGQGQAEVRAEKARGPVGAVRRFARRSVFGTVAQIVRAEGVASLYDGVQAELLKGFFSHGTTMLAKDAVHRLLFRLYLVVVAVVAEVRERQRRPRPQQSSRGVVPKAAETLAVFAALVSSTMGRRAALAGK